MIYVSPLFRSGLWLSPWRRPFGPVVVFRTHSCLAQAEDEEGRGRKLNSQSHPITTIFFGSEHESTLRTIPSLFIRKYKVERFSPKRAAAPLGPERTHPMVALDLFQSLMAVCVLTGRDPRFQVPRRKPQHRSHRLHRTIANWRVQE